MLLAGAAAASPVYSITEITPPEPWFTGVAINDSGQVVGNGPVEPNGPTHALLDALSKNSVSSANFQTIQDGPQVDKPNPYPQPGFPRMNWINCEENESEWVQKPNGKWIYRITLGEVVAVKEFVAGHNPPAQP